jgi:hypothetical protein
MTTQRQKVAAAALATAPAFPIEHQSHVAAGMSVRQCAAIAAMQGILAGDGEMFDAATAVRCADALIAELAK